MNTNNKNNILQIQSPVMKLMLIVVGSIISAYGITLALYAGFGGATLAVLWQGICLRPSDLLKWTKNGIGLILNRTGTSNSILQT